MINIPFQNSRGTLDVQSGTLRFDHGESLDGLFIAQSGAAIQFNGGTYNYSAQSQLTGGGQYLLTGGTLVGLLDYLPNLQLLGGAVGLSPNYQTNGTIVRLDLNGSMLIGSNRVTGTLNLNSGYIGGTVVVQGNGVMNWSNGRFTQGSSLVISTNGLLNMLGGGQKELGGAMTNYGMVAWAGGTFNIMNNNADWSGYVTNAGTFNMQGDFSVQPWFGGGYAIFANGGLFRKSSGTGIGSINVPFLNRFGTVLVQSGVLRFDCGQQLDGVFNTAVGTAIQFNAGAFIYTPFTQLTGGGVFQLTGGSLSGLPDYLPNLQLLGGTVNLSPTYQTNGIISRLDLNGATLASTNIVVSGVLNMVGGSVSGPLTLLPSSVANINGAYLYGTTIISNNATFNWAGGRFAPGSSVLVQTNGLMNMLGGNQKEIGCAFTNYGYVAWSGGSISLLNDGSSYSGMITNIGTWDMQGDLGMNQWFGNDFAAFNNGGLFRKSSGTGVGNMSLIFQNRSGACDIQSGTLRFDHSQQLDGLFMASASAAVQFNSGTFTYTPFTQLTGAGQYFLTGGTLQNLLDYLPNLQLVGGTVFLSPFYQTNGSISRLDLNGSALVGSNRVSGVLNLLNSSTYIYGPVVVSSNAVLNWYGARFAQGSALTVQSNGLVNLLGGAQKELGCGMTNYGHVVWSGGTLNLINDASTWLGGIENQSSGLWDVQGDLNIVQWYANNYAYFRNSGALRKLLGLGTSTLDLPYFNQGTVEHLAGVLNFGRNFSLTDGTVTFGVASNYFARINLAGTASLAGRLSVKLVDGFIPETNSLYQVMNYGVVFGTFTNYDGLNVGFGRYFIPNYSATALTLQTMITNGVNHAPVLSAIANRTVNELSTLTFTNSATDQDNDTILYQIVSAPANATLNLTNGVFSWPTTEQDGPGTNVITIRIYDSGSPSLSATQSFTVVVNEVNTAPVFTPAISLLSVRPGALVTFTNIASDADLPANSLAYSLPFGAPTGLTLNATSGLLSWRPSAAYAMTTNLVTVRATDNGLPPMIADRNISISVGQLSPIQITAMSATQNPVHLTFSTDPGVNYAVQTSTNLTLGAWTTALTKNAIGNTADVYITNGVTPARFLRVKAIP